MCLFIGWRIYAWRLKGNKIVYFVTYLEIFFHLQITNCWRILRLTSEMKQDSVLCHKPWDLLPSADHKLLENIALDVWNETRKRTLSRTLRSSSICRSQTVGECCAWRLNGN
jgi:hypothetical protein